MLPLQLLRVRTRKGAIYPLFCTRDDGSNAGAATEDGTSNNNNNNSSIGGLVLAQQIIQEFKESAKNKEKKKYLTKRIALVEAQYDDYKLVRGLAALLERRCQFEHRSIDSSDESNHTDKNNDDDYTCKQQLQQHRSQQQQQLSSTIEPASIRRMLFEESSKAGFALTEMERNALIESVASKMGIEVSYLRQAVWGDLEENMILEYFDTIKPEDLLGWYNLSLMQTLLFNCTSLEFSISGGTNWKRVLRALKRLGLMYELQQRPKASQAATTTDSTIHAHAVGTTTFSKTTETNLVCLVDGPLSLFKQTDRYGTSIAKLLPSIISVAGQWYIHAWIIRKTMSGKKMYEFKFTSSEMPLLMSSYSSPSSLPSSQLLPYNGEVTVGEGKGEKEGASLNAETKSASVLSTFDSTVEEKFAKRFEQLNSGWNLIREPDPIIISGGRAFIADFMFERYGGSRRVYLEIVGFWTREYLENKLKKLSQVTFKKDIGDNNNDNNSVDLFIAVNQDLQCSKVTSSSFSTLAISPEKILYYRNTSVPVRPILDYLRKIDRDEIERHTRDTNLKIRFDAQKDEVISVDEKFARTFGIPVEAAVKVASRDNADDYLLAGGHYFILKSKAREIGALLAGDNVTRFSDACAILSAHSIPEPCHAELVVKLGFDVIWKSMDASSAVIVKRESG